MPNQPKLQWPKYAAGLLVLGILLFGLWIWREVVRVQRFRRDIQLQDAPTKPPPRTPDTNHAV